MIYRGRHLNCLKTSVSYLLVELVGTYLSLLPITYRKSFDSFFLPMGAPPSPSLPCCAHLHLLTMPCLDPSIGGIGPCLCNLPSSQHTPHCHCCTLASRRSGYLCPLWASKRAPPRARASSALAQLPYSRQQAAHRRPLPRCGEPMLCLSFVQFGLLLFSYNYM